MNLLLRKINEKECYISGRHDFKRRILSSRFRRQAAVGWVTRRSACGSKRIAGGSMHLKRGATSSIIIPFLLSWILEMQLGTAILSIEKRERNSGRLQPSLFPILQASGCLQACSPLFRRTRLFTCTDSVCLYLVQLFQVRNHRF